MAASCKKPRPFRSIGYEHNHPRRHPVWFGHRRFRAPGRGLLVRQLPVCHTFWEADSVFIGRAEVTSLGPGAQRSRFEVEESFRGPTGGVIEIVGRGIGGSCAYGFVQGTRYLVFARRAPDGTWSASMCGSTAPLTEAGEAITFGAQHCPRQESWGVDFGQCPGRRSNEKRPLRIAFAGDQRQDCDA